MANKPLQTIKFPGLTDTYTVPQVDSNFVGTAGQVPDSKKVYDKIDSLKEDLSDLERATSLTTTISYLNDGELLTNGYIDSQGAFHSHPFWMVTDFVSLDAVVGIYAHVGAYVAYPLAVYYDADKQVISYESVDRNYQTNYTNIDLTIPGNAVYCRVNMWLDKGDGSHDDQYIVLTNTLQSVINSKVSSVNGIRPNGDGDVILDIDPVIDVQSMESMTDTGKLYRYDGKIYYYNGTEWAIATVEAGEDTGSIIKYIQRNLLNNTTFTVGYLNNQNGQIQTAQTSYRTSDYIPVKDVWYDIYNVDRYCVYDENKQFINGAYGSSTYPYRPTISSGHAYIRVSALDENIDEAVVCELEHYYPNEDAAQKHPTQLNVSGDNFAPKLISDVANNDLSHFTDGANLFDVNGGYLYVCGTGGAALNASTGDLFTSPIMALNSNNYRFNNVAIPQNGCISSTYFIPVESGKYLFTNYGYWDSPLYDSDKNYVTSLVKQYPYAGSLIPDGVSFARLNFKADGTLRDGFLQTVEEAKNIMVWQEDEAVCTRPATTLQKQIDGSFVSPNYLDKVVPNMVGSDFLSAMKCMTVREINRRDHAWRFGNFNAYVGTGTNGYYLIRKMLMDNGIDFCGFEEMSGRATDIGTYLKSWQFADGFASPKDSNGKGTNSLSLVSRFEVQTWNTYTMTTVSSNKDCINARIRLPRYLDVYNPFKVLSMYVIHQMVGANQQNLANELLSIIANDDSDYIVIASDTNSFGDTEEDKVFWRVLESGGFRPTIPISTKTITQDIIGKDTDEYPEKQWHVNSIDQFFISSNIDCVSYNVINTKDEYAGSMKGTSTDNEYALSDHDFVYADLVFKDEVRQ